MKRIFLALMTIIISTLSANVSADKSTRELERREHDRMNLPFNRADELQNHANISRDGYVPSDLMGQGGGTGFRCNESGYKTSQASENCVDYKSRSQGTMWRIRFASQHGSSAEYVYKLTKGQPTLWVQFDPGNQRTLYASPGAQQYAAANSGESKGGQSQQYQQQTTNNVQCERLSGKARGACEVGSGLLPNIDRFLKW